MQNKEEAKQRFVDELSALRQRVAELEQREAALDQSRRALNETNARLSAIINAFDGFMYVCSQDYRVEFMNQKLIERTGYDGTGEFCYKVLHERDSICPWCINERVFRGETVRWEIKSPKDDMWLYVVNTPLYNVDGTVCKMSMMLDYTDLKQAEQALQRAYDTLEQMVEERTAELSRKNRELLREIEEHGLTEEALKESEQNYRSVIDHIGIGVAVISPQMEILTLNNRMKEWFPHIDVSSKPICYESFNDPPLRSICSYCPTYKTLQDGQVHESITDTPAGNNIVHYRIISTPIKDKDDNIIASIEMVEDITARRQSEDALRQTNAYLENVFENSPDAIGIVDRNGEFIMWNKMAAELYGYSFEELQGKSSYDYYADADQLQGMLETLRREGSVKRREMKMKRKDGSVFPCELSISLLRDVSNMSIGSVCVARDLSDVKRILADLQTTNLQLRREILERKRAEEELREYHDHLEDLVRERTNELAKTNDQLTREIEERKRVEAALKDASEKLKLFAYSVAHDLKSPAIGIYGLTRRLHKQYKDILDEKARNYCDQILKVSEHIAALVDKINIYMTTKEARLSPEKIYFKDILQTVKDEFASQLTVRRIDWLEPENAVEFTADRLSILRVFRNLVDNSLKYGGERLTKISVEYEERDDFHVFSVIDNGKGFKAEDAEKVFRPFQRHETSRGVEGAGLGLTIVKEIAEQHGGRVWVEPKTQKGTTFCLSISKHL